MKKVAALLLLALPATAATWTNVSSGLTGAVPEINQVVSDPSTGSTLYALTPGGVFKSADGGSRWTALGNIAGVNVLALDPASSSTVYAGTAHGVVKTIDGGRTWSQTALSSVAVRVIAVNLITPSTLYAGGDGVSIYRTSDGGTSWSSASLNSPAPAIGSIAVDPLMASTIYAMPAGPSTVLYKSVDGGQTFNLVNTGPFFLPLLVTDPSVPSTLYAVGPVRGAALAKSTDGGVTWSATGFAGDPISLAIDPHNSNTLYVSTAGPANTGQAIMKSIDGGQNWVAVDTIIPAAHSVVVGPNSSIFATTATGVFKSSDGGMNWGETNTGLRVFDIQVLTGNLDQGQEIYAGGNYGLFKSADGVNWTERAAFQVSCCQGPPGFPPGPAPISTLPLLAPAGVNSLFIDFKDRTTLYASTGRIGGCFAGDINLHKSTDDGANWSDLDPGVNGCETGPLLAMDPTDPNTLYLLSGDSYDGYALEKTTDGGAHWNYAGLAPNQLSALVIDPTAPSIVYASTDRGVMRTANGGASWDPTGLTNTNVSLLAIDPVHPNILYAVASGVYRSADSGASWSPINQGLGDIFRVKAPVNALLIDSDQPSVLYLATSGYGVYRSSDRGVSWSPFNGGLANLDVRSLVSVAGPSTRPKGDRRAAAGRRSIYAGTPGGIFSIAVGRD